MPAPAASQAMPAAAAAPSSCGPGTAASAGGEPSPAIQLPNWTPPAAAQGTPPLDGAAGASPGSFWEVLNAEILLSPDGLAPNPGAGGGMPAPAAAMLPPAQAPPQQLAPPPQQLPAVQGLPTPPGPPLQGLQRWPTPDEAALASAASLGSAGGGSKYALVHTAQLLVDPKLTKGAPRMLGLAEVSGAASHPASQPASPPATQPGFWQPTSACVWPCHRPAHQLLYAVYTMPSQLPSPVLHDHRHACTALLPVLALVHSLRCALLALMTALALACPGCRPLHPSATTAAGARNATRRSRNARHALAGRAAPRENNECRQRSCLPGRQAQLAHADQDPAVRLTRGAGGWGLAVAHARESQQRATPACRLQSPALPTRGGSTEAPAASCTIGRMIANASPTLVWLQAFLTRMLDGGVVGVVGLHKGAVGMLRPGRHPATQQLLLQMMIVPNAMPSGG